MNDSRDLIINGVKVTFPCKPYPSQLCMMHRIIKGLQSSQHCLLESPTGSGKSLALLCSALAWQQGMKQKVMEENEQPEEDSLKSGSSTDDFEQESKTILKGTTNKSNSKKVKVPTIWFGTRTHKQIAQITHEMSRTVYKSTNMSILSSREHSCIHPINEKSKNKNDGCRDLKKGKHADLPGSHCAFHQNVHRMKTHSNLYSCGITNAWDLEELVQLGRRIRACPYYSTRELKNTASIVFCPYNYLIDPNIRAQMSINLKDEIVILDEAHNIEDSARVAASFTMQEMELVNTIADLDHLITDGVKVEEHQMLHLLCTKIGQWIHKSAESLIETSYETWSKVWIGPEFISHLTAWGITGDTLPILRKNFHDVMEEDEENEEEENKKMLHTASQNLISGLFQVLDYLLRDSGKFTADYRITIIRTSQYGVPPPKRTKDGWIALNKRATKYFSINLHFWCLNPAVAFGDLSSTRCVILTSGTLSPMSTFSSELGLPFPVVLEASHVIADTQVWVGSVGTGPTGHPLQATYQNTSGLKFQDELGLLIQVVCNVVPHGVLCFFSSYSLLEKLCDRWKSTGLWEEISKKKAIFSEPHGKNKSDFQEILNNFYVNVSSDDSNELTGSLLFAVCRGKVSEGLDFSDDNARAVITVGIPFPNLKDKQVELKRKYNDQHSKSRGLLSGSEWYEIQAFRALNQALGRCIRHKNDWGALIIVDDRFCKNPRKYCKGLSKWVRSKVTTYKEFGTMQHSLSRFCHVHKNGLIEVPVTADIPLREEYVPVSGTNSSKSTDVNKSIHCDTKRSDLVMNSLVASSNNRRSPILSKPRIFSLLKEDSARAVESPKLPSITQATCKPIPVSQFNALTTTDEMIADNPAANRMDCEVLIIPSTPEKLKDEVIVIPESPEHCGGFDEDDFKPLQVSKRKSFPGRSSNTIAQWLSKRCKQSLNADECETSTPQANEPNNTPEECLEMLSSSKRKRGKSKNTASKRFNFKQGDFFAHKSVHCNLCHEKLFVKNKNFKTSTEKFHYVQETFSDEKLYVVESLPQENLLEKVIASLNGVVLDAMWCSADELAYQFYQCKDCKTVVGFSLVNRNCKFYALSSKVTT